MGTGASSLRHLSVEQVIQNISEYLQQRRLSIKDAFTMLDIDESGYITWDEFVRGFHLCVEGASGEVPSTTLYPVFKRFDLNGDGRLSIEELAAAFEPPTTYGGRLGPGVGVSSPSALSSGGARRPGRQRRREQLAQDVVERIACSLKRTGHTTQDLFEKLDANGNAKLSRIELEGLLTRFQPDLSLSEKETVYERFDRDKNGDVDMSEFIQALEGANAGTLVAIEDKMQLVGQRFNQQTKGYSISESFMIFDRDNDGYLSMDEWLRAMEALGLKQELGQRGLQEAFRRFDANDDGVLNLQEFQAFFQDGIDRRPKDLSYGVIPDCARYPEEDEEAEALDTLQSAFSEGRSGIGITEVFRRFDIDSSGGISLGEFSRIVSTFRPNLSEEHIHEMFYKVNVSGSGAISLPEFVRRFG